MITISDVKKIYHSKSGPISAVDGVSINVDEGEIFGVIGYSGAGKSTLIRMLNGLEVPTDGTVDVNGKIVSQVKGRELREARQSIGMIFQHFNLLWSRTVTGKYSVSPRNCRGFKEGKNKACERIIRTCWITRERRCLSISIERGAKTTSRDCEIVSK